MLCADDTQHPPAFDHMAETERLGHSEETWWARKQSGKQENKPLKLGWREEDARSGFTMILKHLNIHSQSITFSCCKISKGKWNIVVQKETVVCGVWMSIFKVLPQQNQSFVLQAFWLIMETNKQKESYFYVDPWRNQKVLIVFWQENPKCYYIDLLIMYVAWVLL